jgi:hypothetical protein
MHLKPARTEKIGLKNPKEASLPLVIAVLTKKPPLSGTIMD